jgi:hypothetical protein
MAIIRGRPRALVSIALIVIAVLGYALLMAKGEDQPNTRFAAEAREVDPTNPDQVREWAELMCHGRTLVGLARSVDVEPTLDAVVWFFSRRFSPEAKAAFREVCERELSRSEAP